MWKRLGGRKKKQKKNTKMEIKLVKSTRDGGGCDPRSSQIFAQPAERKGSRIATEGGEASGRAEEEEELKIFFLLNLSHSRLQDRL